MKDEIELSNEEIIQLAKSHGATLEERSDKPGFYIVIGSGKREISLEDILGN
ncbi:hypothetical protein [Paenibacillus xylanexedens]|uniref:hypothetical protein n=1 Tax=Paenibacillus xylanexedens TaxID=528191 RepID=UPI00142E899C|nr:hypothetical protein [Paenibacillus xylanexedens]